MKLCVNSWSYREAIEDRQLDLPGLFDEASRAGITALEAAGAHFPTVNDVFLNELALCRRRTGTRLAVITLANDFAHPDAGERAQQVSDLMTWMDVAVRLGVKMLAVGTGNLSALVEAEQSRRWVRQNLARVARAAARRGRVLAVQDSGSAFATITEVLGLLEELKSPGLAPAGDLDKLTAEEWQQAAPCLALGQLKVTDQTALTPHLTDRLRSLGRDTLLSLLYRGGENPTGALTDAAGALRALGVTPRESPEQA